MSKLLQTILATWGIFRVPEVGIDQVREALAKPEGPLLLDVRTPGEFADGHLPKALNIDFFAPDFHQRVQALDKRRDYILYCLSGNRSVAAARALRQLGFEKASSFRGGIRRWKGAIER